MPQKSTPAKAAPEDPRFAQAVQNYEAGLRAMQEHKFEKAKGLLEKIIEKMSHAVATCFEIKDRGFIREGYYADLVLVDLDKPITVVKENILYKCGWSPFEGQSFPAAVTHTFVNGNLVYGNGVWNESIKGKRLTFER